MPTVAVNGTRLYYELSGSSPIALVLVHGSWGDHENWERVVPELARSFRVLTYDRRGHSQSARSTSQGSLDEDAQDLAALLEALDMTPAHIAGNSGGAAVALRLATRRSELFRSLIVHEPPLFALLAGDATMHGPLSAVEQRIAAVVELLRAGDAVGGARRFVETIAFGPGAWDALPESRRATFVGNAPTFLDEQQDPDGASVDVEALRRFSAPTLLTRGEQSPPFFPAVVARLARALPHAAQHLFIGAGHVPHVTDPQAYVELVSGFIAGVEASSTPADHATNEGTSAASGRSG